MGMYTGGILSGQMVQRNLFKWISEIGKEIKVNSPEIGSINLYRSILEWMRIFYYITSSIHIKVLHLKYYSILIKQQPLRV